MRRQQASFTSSCQFRVKAQGNLGGFSNNFYLKNEKKMVYEMGKPYGLNKLGHFNATFGNQPHQQQE
jgi:hypothetical protein